MSRSEYDAFRSLAAPPTDTGKLRTLDVLAYEAAKLKVDAFACTCPPARFARLVHLRRCPVRVAPPAEGDV
jgi:hypothetical protein